jgi:hypothetical protein
MIEFNGIDILVRHRPDDASVLRALAAALGVPEGRVALIDDVSEYPKPDAADVVCVSSSLEGDFTGLLSIQVEHLTLPYDTREQLVQRLCELLDAQCLIPEEEENPYIMWLVSPEAASCKIALDPIAFDEGQYVIARRLEK